MTVKFCFGNKRNDGRQNLKIRLKHHGKDAKIGIPGVYIESKHWDKSNLRIKNNCENAQIYNDIVSKYSSKINEVKGLLELRQINFETAKIKLSNSSHSGSIFEFIETYCNDYGQQWKRNTNNVLNTFKNHLNLKDVLFEDINRYNFDKLKKTLESKGSSASTFNNYVRHIKAVYNHALDKKATYRKFDFSKIKKIKINNFNRKLKTNTKRDVFRAIDKIKIKSKHRSAQEYAIRDLEAIGFWLLMFSLRGFYGKDIVSLSSYNNDYNYKYRLEYLKVNANQNPQIVKGNPFMIDHPRHKTKNMMRIWISLPPITSLIFVLKKLVAHTHPDVSYLSVEDLKLTHDQQLNKIEDYDELKIFKHNPVLDHKTDDAIWNNFNKHLRKLDMYSFKSARKTFNTIATTQGIHPSITKILLGQTDQTIQKHYNNYNDINLVQAVQEAHLKVLNAFNMIEMYDKWIFKIQELFGKFNDLEIGGGSTVVYEHQIKFLKTEVLKSNETLIDNENHWIKNYKS